MRYVHIDQDALDKLPIGGSMVVKRGKVRVLRAVKTVAGYDLVLEDA